MRLNSRPHEAKVLAWIAALAFAWTFGAVADDQLVVSRLADGRCRNNLDVNAPKKMGDDTVFEGDCVLSFTHPDDNGSEGKEAVIRINGSDVPLRVIRKVASYPNVHYELKGVTEKLSVIMDLKEDCPAGTEGCDFTGTMKVVSDEGSAKIHIVYYRGG
jgi:hypothetical protein